MRELGSRRTAWTLGWAVLAFLYAPLVVMAKLPWLPLMKVALGALVKAGGVPAS